MTTNEYVKNIYNEKDNPNPFNEGILENCRIFLKTKKTPKQINMNYLFKRDLEENKSKKSSQVEFSHKCDICPNFSNKNEQNSNNKIQENLLS